MQQTQFIITLKSVLLTRPEQFCRPAYRLELCTKWINEKFQLKTQKGKDHLRAKIVDVRIILKFVLNEKDVWTGFISLWIWTNCGIFKCDNKSLDFIKVGKFRNWLANYQYYAQFATHTEEVGNLALIANTVLK